MTSLSNPKSSLEAESSSRPSTEEPASHRYWKTLSGFNYLEMIRRREAGGSLGYAQQERVLTQLVEAQREHLGRDVDVLEFGCGFGRHAAYLSRVPGIRYHGYDFSETMVEPLRQSPPQGMVPLESRLLVGPDVRAAVGSQRFDVVFTVSVLIHNPPEHIPGLLRMLAEVTSPGGVICLVENKAVPFSLFENGWHQGCWLHAYADSVPEGWDLHLGQSLVDTHDVYLLCRNEGGPRRVFRMEGLSLPPVASEPLSSSGLLELGMPKLRAWTEAQRQAMAVGTEARISELEEQLAVERERAARRQRILSLSDELARMRVSRPSVPVPVPTPKVGADRSGVTSGVLVNDELDTRWAYVEPRLSRCTHVFHQEWSGIRAASGFIPGRKIAITAERPLTPAEYRRIIEDCASSLTRVVIFQGYSSNTSELIRLMRHSLGHSVRLLAVWHGATTQFHFSAELDGFTELLALRRQGLLDGLACVKPEMHVLSDLIFPQTLLNLPPRVPVPPPYPRPTMAALIPTPNNWWKNFHTNLLAAASHRRLKRVYITSSFEQRQELPLRNEVMTVGRLQRSDLFRFFREVDVLLNVTLTECQPMTALEGLAFGVPCLTGPLSLGPLDLHPYQKLVQVMGTGSLMEIQAALERVLELRETSPAELREMMLDYTRVLHSEAIRRYLEFTQL